MAWDTEATRAALLAAAVLEFSENGFAGARVDRISARAGINRERLYSYFGNKRQLFEAVLADQLVTILDGVPVCGSGCEAAGDFAGRYFDACKLHPALPRLVFWEGLELVHPIDVATRTSRARSKATELELAIGDIDAAAADELLLTIVTLCHAWFATPNVSLIVVGDDQAHARRRETITTIAMGWARQFAVTA
ncbi:TetR family transcriptional regulator [Subtercola frigoramans]|uniref:AcrR family transcriptional regulator n=1 Tax=Subtercola frigoramans TaxID=120298 RepID=A0ABS2L143_9MICO|nr:TetR family transcriptional regulator [Subtercola frigoramans]MBM7470801.1 AcrR family transcriptional regulator [Subtercola frigoramans]